MNLYCVGHKPPLFFPNRSFKLVSPSFFSGFDQLIIGEDALGENFHGEILSEYTQLFGLAEYLKNHHKNEKFYIYQYRKFISFCQSTQLSANQAWSHVSSPSEAASLFPSSEELLGLEGHLFVGPALHVRSLADQYSTNHLIEDFIKFILSLSTLNSFNSKRCQEFIDCEILFPAPSLGVTQVDVFLRHMAILKMTWEHFYNNFYKPRDGYQRRVGGFLLERLHSFLIFQDINVYECIKATHGFQIVISDSPWIAKTVGARPDLPGLAE
jgi:hypothetical protein